MIIVLIVQRLDAFAKLLEEKVVLFRFENEIDDGGGAAAPCKAGSRLTLAPDLSVAALDCDTTFAAAGRYCLKDKGALQFLVIFSFLDKAGFVDITSCCMICAA